MGISMAVARVVVGYIIDKLFAPKVALVVFLSVLFGVGLLIYGQHLALYFIAAVLMGIGIGTVSDLMACPLEQFVEKIPSFNLFLLSRRADINSRRPSPPLSPVL